jgi:hypothetical protein
MMCSVIVDLGQIEGKLRALVQFTAVDQPKVVKVFAMNPLQLSFARPFVARFETVQQFLHNVYRRFANRAATLVGRIFNNFDTLMP